jgi:hypothetical protein
MLKEMCWMSAQRQDFNSLHLRTRVHDAWRTYTAFPEYAVLDSAVPGGSKGWATFQKLSQAGWTLVPAAIAFSQSPAAHETQS